MNKEIPIVQVSNRIINIGDILLNRSFSYYSMSFDIFHYHKPLKPISPLNAGIIAIIASKHTREIRSNRSRFPRADDR